MAKVYFNCEECSKETGQWNSVYKKSQHHFCSLSCGITWRNKNTYNPSWHRDLSGENNPMWGKGHLLRGKQNPMYGKRGELCPNWKGGRRQRGDGYWRITIDGKRVLEHRKVLEESGVDINNKVVHHKNGNKGDNAIENLEAITQSEHINIHRPTMF